MEEVISITMGDLVRLISAAVIFGAIAATLPLLIAEIKENIKNK